MALFTKYRPSKFDEMIGNKHVTDAVKALVAKKEVPHSWMFTGNSGSGKTTIARIIAKELGASKSGIFEINTSSIRGIDGIRDIISKAQYRVPGSKVSVYILDECHQLTKDAQNALLKVLEDSPAHAYFILATTDPQKLLGTIRTRCEEFKFDPIGTEELVELVADIADQENIKLSDDILVEISTNAAGSPRLALNMLERCSVVGDNMKEARKLISGLGIDFQVEGEFTISGDIFNAMLNNRNARSAWKKIAKILDEEVLKANIDVNSVKQGLTSRMGRFLLKTANGGIADAVLILESIQNMYSNASFIAVMYKVVQAYYNSGGISGQSSTGIK